MRHVPPALFALPARERYRANCRQGQHRVD
jgi:hypothetical protein